MAEKRIQTELTQIYQSGKDLFTYIGWPTVARLKDGTLIVGASGGRSAHICPFGKTYIFKSTDNGKSWSRPTILNNSLIDDRDVGVTALPDGGYLVEWFSSDTRYYGEWFKQNAPEQLHIWGSVIEAWEPEAVKQSIGSFIRRVYPDGRIGKPHRVALTAPHGPVFCGDELFHIGQRFGETLPDGTIKPTSMSLFSRENAGNDRNKRGVEVHVSKDFGETWEERSVIPLAADDDIKMAYYEPTICRTQSGRLLALIRREPMFSTVQSESDDNGRTWNMPHTVIPHGAPAFVLCHSSGVLVMTYTYRQEPYGIHAALSYDNGATWDIGYVLDDGFNSSDCGYPSSVELEDGTILTAWYRQGNGKKSGLWQGKWKLPVK